jgi:3-oxoacyl-[acyl-carrier-protein] synthase II
MTEVCITGIGAITPLGNDFQTFSENLLAGRSGVAAHCLFPREPNSRQLAARIGEIPLPPTCDRQWFDQMNPLERLALSCTTTAWHDSGLQERREELRIGLILGLGAEYLRIWEIDRFAGGDRMEQPSRDSRSVVQLVHSELQLSGPAISVAAACASGGIALTLGRRWVRTGLVDVCLVGGCDLVTPLSYAGFYNLRALSRSEGAPAAASRPFDRDRDGFVMGEGGAVLVLEAAGSARGRGAQIYAELAGCGLSSDAAHMVIPSSDPRPASRAMLRALEDAGLTPDDLDYVNAHATSTPVGDRAEAQALQLALGSSAARVPVSSTKSMTGHLLSAAAAVEALVCIAALRAQAVPPTINLDNPDPECPVRHVPNQAWNQPVRAAASNSFGFGGSNTCVVFKRAA